MKRIILAALAALALCGCGGGGGGDPSLDMSMPTVPLKASFFPGELPGPMVSSLTLQGDVPPGVHVLITDGDINIDRPNSFLFQTGPTSWEVRLTVRRGLPVGLRKGTLRVAICTDSSCGKELGSASRPYEITVKAPEIAAIPDPLVSAVLGEGLGVRLKLGVNGADPASAGWVSAVDPAGRIASTAVRLTEDEPGTGRYKVDLPWAPGQAAQAYSGTLTLRFCSDEGCAAPYMTRSLSYRVQAFDVVGGVCCVSGLAVDGADNLYIADGERIRRLTPAGVASSLFTRAAGSPHPAPHAVAVSPEGVVYFSEPGLGISRIDTGGAVSRFSDASVTDMGFGGGFLYYTNDVLEKATKVSTDNAVQVWGPAFALQRPIGIAVSPSNVVHVADLRGVVSVRQEGSTQLLPPLPGEHRPVDVAPAGSTVLVTTTAGLYRITGAGAVETIVPPGVPVRSREGAVVSFSPESLARTGTGRVYVADAHGLLLVTNLP